MSVESHRDIPCAKIAITLKDFGKTIGMSREEIVKSLPKDSKVNGDMTMDATIIIFYTLDRGIPLDTDLTIKGVIDLTVLAKDPSTQADQQVSIKGNVMMTGQRPATKFPAYDASLLSASPAKP